jgi:hypothetical protein
MNQLRIYHLTDKEAANTYFTTYWPRHLESLPKFGFKVEGLWLGQSPENENQVIAMVSFPDGENIEELNRRYMSSPEFRQEMAGFDKHTIQRVEELLMKPSADFLMSLS